MDTLVIYTDNKYKLEAMMAVAKAMEVPFELEPEVENYDPEFVAKIERGREDMKTGRGRVISMEELDSLWK